MYDQNVKNTAADPGRYRGRGGVGRGAGVGGGGGVQDPPGPL